MAKLSLLKQAEIELRRRKFSKMNVMRDGKIDRVEAIKKLLPNYDIQPKPKKFHQSKKPDKWLIGGYGSGKTYSFCAEGIFLAWVNAPIPGLLITQTKGNARATTLETLYELMDKNNIYYKKTEAETYIIIEIDFGEGLTGKLNIASGFNYVSLKGPNMAFCGIDEPFVISKETYEVVISRARHPEAKINEVFCCGTIEPLKMEWGFDIVDESYTGDESTFKIVVSSYDNKYATKDYLQRIERRFDDRMKEVYLKGRNVDLNASRVYTPFESGKNVIAHSAINEKKINQLIIGYDFNVNPMCAVGIEVEGKKRIQAYEWKLNSSDSKELSELIVAELSEIYPEEKPSLIITGDASGRKKTSNSMGLSDYMIIKRVFEESGFYFSMFVPESNPFVRDRVNYVNSLIENKLFLISDRCKESILDRRLVVWKKTAEGFTVDKSKPDRTHLSDASDYALWLTRQMGVDSESGRGGIYSERRER